MSGLTKNISNKLSEYLYKKGLTAYAVSKKTGISINSIENYKKGESTPNYNNLLILFDKFPDLEGFLNSDLKEKIKIVSEPLANYELTKNTNYKIRKSEPIPYYDVDFIAGNSFETVESTKTVPDYYMDVPEFSGCTAFRAYSDSMNNIIKSGNILFATKQEQWHEHLEFGQIYGIVCTDGRKYLKYIKRYKENPKDYFLLESENKHYDEFEMPKKYIRGIWLIHGWLNKSV